MLLICIEEFLIYFKSLLFITSSDWRWRAWVAVWFLNWYCDASYGSSSVHQLIWRWVWMVHQKDGIFFPYRYCAVFHYFPVSCFSFPKSLYIYLKFLLLPVNHSFNTKDQLSGRQFNFILSIDLTLLNLQPQFDWSEGMCLGRTQFFCTNR